MIGIKMSPSGGRHRLSDSSQLFHSMKKRSENNFIKGIFQQSTQTPLRIDVRWSFTLVFVGGKLLVQENETNLPSLMNIITEAYEKVKSTALSYLSAGTRRAHSWELLNFPTSFSPPQVVLCLLTHLEKVSATRITCKREWNRAKHEKRESLDEYFMASQTQRF